MPIHIALTGASRGIGAAIEARLTEAGARVSGFSSKDVALEKPGCGSALWSLAMERLEGRVDVLINNAGIFEANPLENEDWAAQWDRTMQINLTSSASLCREAVMAWQKTHQPGRIINIASRAAYRGDSPLHWHYAASKGGMVAMTKTIARAYAAQSILAFAICPGFTMTGMAEDYLAHRGGEKLLQDIPLGRVATAEEIAEIVAFCALSAPPSMTGAVLDANGASYVR